MTALNRSMRKNLVLILLSLALVPVATAWGQVPESPPDTSTASGGATTQDPVPSALSSQAPSDKAETADPVSGFSFLRVVGGLGLVLSLIILGTFGVRKYAPQYFTKRAPERSLKLLETLPMGERRSIAVIEVEEKRLLVGNTPNQITLLAMLGDNSPLPADHEMTAEPKDSRPSASSFKNLYEFEKNGPARGRMTIIPPDIRAKMRQLRESLER